MGWGTEARASTEAVEDWLIEEVARRRRFADPGVWRLQNLTKQLKRPVLGSAAFVGPIRERFELLGRHSISGFNEMLEVYAPRG